MKIVLKIAEMGFCFSTPTPYGRECENFEDFMGSLGVARRQIEEFGHHDAAAAAFAKGEASLEISLEYPFDMYRSVTSQLTGSGWAESAEPNAEPESPAPP